MMTESQPAPPNHAPLGTLPRRPAWPLVVLIVIFAAWFAILIFLAVRFPAVR